MADHNEIAAQLRRLATGRVEWRVQHPVQRCYCMSFSRDDSLYPEREAREWLADFQRRFPEHDHAKYEVAEVHSYTELERVALEAAELLAPKEAPSEASRWPNMNQTVAANAFWHPPHPVLKGWIHDCVYSTGQVLLPEGSTCTNCGATMIAPATPGTPGGGR